jgi:hypothetical protein
MTFEPEFEYVISRFEFERETVQLR